MFFFWTNENIVPKKHNAAKFTTNKYPKKGHYHEFSISQIIKDLNWDSLEERRQKARATTAYKILSDKLILSANLLPPANPQHHTRSTEQVKVGPDHHLKVPHARLNNVEKTFLYSAQQIWKSRFTPQQAKSASVDSFKNNFT